MKNLSHITLVGSLFFSSVFSQEINPGVERRSIKTSVPTNAHPTQSKIVEFDELINLPDPVAHPKMNDQRFLHERYPAFENKIGVKEGDVLTVYAWLHLIAGESDGDYHCQLSNSKESGDHCLIVSVPWGEPEFSGSSELRKKVAEVRDFLKMKVLRGNEPSAGGTVIKKPLFVQVTGQLFFDDSFVGVQPCGKNGMKPATLWELQPVIAIELVEP